jgi:hypothetical protein
VEDINREISHLGDFIEDTVTITVPVADMTIVLHEAESVRSMRERNGLMPQLTATVGGC